MAKGYDATKASEIKRLNERQAEIGRKFGFDSVAYQDYHNALVLAVGPENINAAGNIKRGPVTYAILDNEKMSALLRHQTAGQIKKAAKREAKIQSEITDENVSWQEIMEERDYMNKIAQDASDDFYETMKFYWDSVDGKGNPRPTYSQAHLIYDTIKPSLQKKRELADIGIDYNPFDPENISDDEMEVRAYINRQNDIRQSRMLASYFG